MITQLIGIKEFKENIAKYAQKAKDGKVRYVVMNRNNPLFEIKALTKNEELEAVFSDILSAQEDLKKGRLHSQEEILAEFA